MSYYASHSYSMYPHYYDGYMGNHHYYGGYIGDCHPACNGCSGPYASDCNSCCANAHSFNGYCTCMTGYYGYNCGYTYTARVYGYNGICSPTCAGNCYGPDACDCDNCGAHMNLNYWGYCVCQDGYYGLDCSRTASSYAVYTGTCDPVCGSVCYGPEACDCDECGNNSYQNAYGYCNCFDGYYGDHCDLTGDQHEHTYYNNGVATTYSHIHDGYIGNHHYYGGFIGDCHPVCNGCSGPYSSDCNVCGNNAYFNSGYCRCNTGFYGYDCSHSYAVRLPNYYGDCHHSCGGHCHGPDACECDSCGLHSHMNYWGYCVCDDGFVGQGCGYHHSHVSADATCYHTCSGGCYGPEIYDCVGCCDNSYMDAYGYCTCYDGYFGDHCDQTHDISDHYHHQHNAYTAPHTHYYDGYIGNHHYHGGYIGDCHPACNGCSGPYSSDCTSCCLNAYSFGGYCRCNDGYYGYDCSLTQAVRNAYYFGDCHHSCGGNCYGPDACDCDACGSHSHYDYWGYCVCDDGYAGHHCSANHTHSASTNCYYTCSGGCYGPEMYDCVSCSDNAYMDAYGYCACQDGYYGDYCDQTHDASDHYHHQHNAYTAPHTHYFDGYIGNHHYYNGYIGDCHPACNGCSGPYASDCTSCCPNSYTHGGYCRCNDGYYGYDCSRTYTVGRVYFPGDCHHSCGGNCYGPDACDCDQCGGHSHLDYWGYCVCDDGYAGTHCGFNHTHSYDLSTCYHSCTGGCYGPEMYDCVSCTDNAYMDAYGYCSCFDGYFGDHCDQTHDVSDHYHHQHNAYTAPHTHFYDGYIGNHHYYGGYVGDCHPACNGCSGPYASDCTSCCFNAYSHSGYCRCQDGYYGYDCSQTFAVGQAHYHGDCHHSCGGLCYGPESCDCDACGLHSHSDYWGYCVCDDGYVGQHCSSYHIHTIPNETCYHTCTGGCYGPEMYDCVSCCDNAYMDAYGYCTCQDGYYGDLCDQTHDISDHYHHQHSAVTAPHTHYYDGYIGNHHYYGGYVGDCHPVCNGCSGPYASDCSACGNHSYVNGTHCACLDGYYGYDCSLTYTVRSAYYHGDCHHSCGGTCYGPEACDCDSCGTHSHLDYWGYCTCDDGYVGSHCSGYHSHVNSSATCYHSCTGGCYGPEAYDCVSCCDNAYMDAYGYCTCYEGYYGDLCDHTHDVSDHYHVHANGFVAPHYHHFDGYIGNHHYHGGYVGDCHPACNGCSGPYASDCNNCCANAYRVQGYCRCHDGYYGYDCTHTYAGWTTYYTGNCHQSCGGLCYGPDACDCEACGPHSVLNEWGYCVCESGFAGQHCAVAHTAQINVTCYYTCTDGCYGAEAYDCVNCCDNSYMDAYGYCICYDGYYGDYCDQTHDISDHYHHQYNALTVPHTHYYDGYTGNNHWHGGFTGNCHPACNGCTGHYASDCASCGLNAYLYEGYCRCNNGYYGYDCSHTSAIRNASYYGTCHHACGGICWGPEPYDCDACGTHSHLDYWGLCVCDDHYVGQHCGVSHTHAPAYDSNCYHTCSGGCYGPELYDCVGCCENAYMDAYGYCTCFDGFYGDFCDQNYSHTHDFGSGLVAHSHVYDGYMGNHYYYGGYHGDCHPACNGCAGPYASDCINCCDHAYAYDGYCRCMDGYYGYNCSLSQSTRISSYYHGNCHMSCGSTCYGPEPYDCDACGAHSHLDYWGFCSCDQGYAGIHCAADHTHAAYYAGACYHSCSGGCYGPEAYDCVGCCNNAYMDMYGYCTCYDGWYGDLCDQLQHGRTLHGGYGNAMYGGTSAAYNPYGNYASSYNNYDYGYGSSLYSANYAHVAPVYNTMNTYYFDGYMGSSHYHGGIVADCHPACNGTCSGPYANNCNTCGIHSHMYNSYCMCNDGWYGYDCSMSSSTRGTYYTGTCHSACGGYCYGPNAYDCDGCGTHSHLDYWGYCICDSNYYGPDCTHTHVYDVYDGSCYYTCNGSCHGPNIWDCDTCITNAYMDGYGCCQCMDGYFGDYCDQNQVVISSNSYDDNYYYGPMFSTGPVSTPVAAHTHSAGTAPHYHFYDGYMGGSVYYGGITADCHPACSSTCQGPYATDCNTCGVNAYSVDGYCGCNDGYYGYNCANSYTYRTSYYNGTCHGACNGYCYGADACDCDDCNANAYRDYWGYCICNTGFYGYDCTMSNHSTTYAGHCHTMCDGDCYGPDMYDCMQCTNNAYMDAYGYCMCNSGYYGDYCDLTGSVVTQPTILNASFSGQVIDNYNYGAHSAAPHYHFYDGYMGGTVYYGGLTADCHPACGGQCSGPYASDCNGCNPYAYFHDGYCGCNEGYYGYDCTNSIQFRNMYYAGACHGACNGFCYGTEACDCDACNRNAHLDYWGYCVCNEAYYGYDCLSHNHATVYSGNCHSICSGGCYGPNTCDCMGCINNSYMDSYGYCLCNSGFYGDACDQTQVVMTNSNVILNNSYDDNYYYGPMYSATPSGNFGAHSAAPHYHFYDGYMGGTVYYGGITGDCHPACGGACAGPYASDCNGCGIHSYQHDGYCGCNDGYYGYDCRSSYAYRTTYYTGVCHGACNGYCYGTESCDCDDCNINAHRDFWGYCICNDGYYGYDCMSHNHSVVYPGHCHSLCDGDCYGPDMFDCQTCTNNAYMDAYGYCMCYSGYYGDYCDLQNDTFSLYTCHGYCSGGCSGPYASDCNACVSHSHLDTYGMCACDMYYSGDRCQTYYYYEYNSYSGPCDPICDGCTGTDPTECVKCVQNASWDKTGKCVCNQYYVGDDCATYNYTGECALKCAKCTGPNENQCIQCNTHAVWNNIHECECMPYWTGDHCETQAYRGSCDPKCIGCTGPEPNQCIECEENAVRNAYGYCICEAYWSGDSCENYQSVCDPKCRHCNGPLASDCDICVPNAHLDDIGYCVCDTDWADEDCSYYTGECFKNCSICHGPESCDCDECVENATIDEYGVCRCNDYYTDLPGNACSVYVGPCDPICNGCTGPERCDCEYCVHNASKNDEGFCYCHDWWTEADCSVYKGFCDCKCDHCYGDKACDCYQCAENASFDNHGYCVCDPDWDGDCCLTYVGECHGYCEVLEPSEASCHGPTSHDCTECTTNSYRDNDGFCICAEDWAGETCDDYTGKCDPRCEGCHGPTNSDCEECVVNHDETEWTNNGICICDTNWVLDDCSAWAGECHTVCDTCVGPLNTDCVGCQAHAERTHSGDEAYDSPIGECDCEPNWSKGADCEYSGPCATECADYDGLDTYGCTSPSPVDCIKCEENAHRDSDTGGCVCNQYWSGSNCATWTGPCDPKCDGCNGPTAANCVDRNGGATPCVAHATVIAGSCACDADWDTFADCSEWGGTCDPECRRCNADEPSECYECVDHAYRDEPEEGLGNCICEEDWDSENDCSRFNQDKCTCNCASCHGPTLDDCFECVDNAHRDYNGRCVCADYFSGCDCLEYNGPCDHRCKFGCHGPTDYDCEACVDNAEWTVSLYEEEHCECKDGWTDEDCSVWRGVCSDKCMQCTGPTAFDCVHCTQNAFRVQGECTCQPGWESEDNTENCMKEVIICHVSCSTCNGYQQDDCTACYEGFTLKGGFCIPCHEDCKTCIATDGEDEDQCITCNNPQMFALSSGSACTCCHPSCQTCEDVSTTCTSCWGNDTFSAGICLCESGYRDDETFECVPECPTGKKPDDIGNTTCVDNPVGPYKQYAELDQHFANSITGSLVTFNTSCHPPQFFMAQLVSWDDVASVTTAQPMWAFDGKSTFIEVDNFVPQNNLNPFSFNIWFTVGLNERKPLEILYDLYDNESSFNDFRDFWFPQIAGDDNVIVDVEFFAHYNRNKHFYCEEQTDDEKAAFFASYDVDVSGDWDIDEYAAWLMDDIEYIY